jgi:universal stress protein E
MTAKLKNILAIYDDAVGSDDVLVRAIVLARAANARLTVAKPLNQHPESLSAIEEAHRRLRRIVPWIEQEGVHFVSTEILVGTPHVEIVRQALRQNADLVIANANMRQGIKDMFFGRTATKLLRECPCAVWVVQPGQASRNSILAVVEPTDQPSGLQAGARVVELAVAMARTHQAPLHIVRPWQVEGTEAEMLRSEIDDATRRAILDKHESHHRAELSALLEAHEGEPVDIELHLPRGRRCSTVAALADRLDVGMVITGTWCRPGLLGTVNENPAGELLNALRCGLLVVKPDAFRSSIPVYGADQPARQRIHADTH